MATDCLTTINCGLGRDSIAMLCFLAEGQLLVDGAPLSPSDVDAVIFSDPGAEWDHTYSLLPRVRALCADVGVRFLELRKPPAEVWRANLREKGCRKVPAWASNLDGTIEEKAARGHYHLRLPIIDEYRRFGTIAVTVSASCTSNHKVGPIRRCMDDLAVERFGIDNRRWAHQVRKGLRPKHRVIIGIAADEAERAIDTGRPIYERPVYPLVSMGVSKADEAAVLDRHGFGNVYKSGCVMCPYQGAGWFWVLRETDPVRWAEVLAYEARALEKNPKLGGMGRPDRARVPARRARLLPAGAASPRSVALDDEGTAVVTPDLLASLDRAREAAEEIEAIAGEMAGLMRRARDATTVLEAELHNAFVATHPPVCSKCGGGMTARRRKADGGWFWGCRAYPRCKGALDPQTWRQEAEAALRTATTGA